MWYTIDRIFEVLCAWTGSLTGRKQGFRMCAQEEKGVIEMTGELIKEVKHIQQCLVNKDMEGEEWEEKMEIIHKLEDVVTYLKDAMGRGIEF